MKENPVIRNTQSISKRKKKGNTGVNTAAPKIGMTNLWADEGILPVSGVTEWVISSNEEQQRKGC